MHAVALALLVGIARWLPAPHMEPRKESLTPLFVPEVETPPVAKLPPPPPKLAPPPPKELAKLNTPKITLPLPEPPKIEPPRIEVKPVEAFKMPEPVIPKPELKKEVVTGTFSANEVVTPVALKKEVIKDTFASGSSERVTLQKAPREVQTGGFGDPNGVKGTSPKKGLLTVASLGSFGLPSGAGNGNGTGGAHGARGTVASAGFGDGAAGAGQGDHQRARDRWCGEALARWLPLLQRPKFKKRKNPASRRCKSSSNRVRCIPKRPGRCTWKAKFWCASRLRLRANCEFSKLKKG
jgi:hypothetical protein